MNTFTGTHIASPNRYDKYRGLKMQTVRAIKKREDSADTVSYDLIVIGASMGGFQALKQLISEFPADLPAAVIVVLHISGDHKSYLATSWGQNAKLPVLSAKEGERIKSGHVYVCVPDFHIRVTCKHLSLDHGPKHNFSRPAVDPLFSSAAESYGPRVVGVVLTGALDDGTAGLMDIKKHGGVSVIQNPDDAVNPSMPMSALDCVPIDHCVPLSEMGSLLSNLAGQPVDASLVEQGKNMANSTEPELSTHICPECNGPMWLVETGKLLHFHCRIGHSFSGQSLLVEKTLALESALWSAVNALKDKADISKKLARRTKNKSYSSVPSDYFQTQAANAEAYAKVITEIILKEKSPTALSSKKQKRRKKPRNGKQSKAA